MDRTAKALRAAGFQEGDRIPVFVQAVPAHYVLLLAAEKIGAAIICRDDTPEELCFAIRKTTATTVFVHDHISKEEEELFRSTTQITNIVKISPFDYAEKESIPDGVLQEIQSRYPGELEDAEGDLSWEEFLSW